MTLDAQDLYAALIGCHAETVKLMTTIQGIDAQIRELIARNGTAPKKRTMSAEARRRMSIAQRKRWAERKRKR